MAKANRVKASTQKFTEIVDIVDSVVLLQGGYACSVIEVTASNFALLSKKEQDAKVYAYASLLNSLSFPIQIVVRNERVDISAYIKSLEEQERETKNELLANHIRLYKDFVHQMLRVNVVLNKQFYIVISYSSLEQGVTGAAQTGSQKGAKKDAFAEGAKKALASKTDQVLTQLKRLSLSSEVLEKEALVKLYYNIYNQDMLEIGQVADDLETPMIRAKE